jgi:hypothetical protein
MSASDIASNLRLCEQKVLQLNAIQCRFVAGLRAKVIVTEDEACILAEIAEQLRLANTDEPRNAPSADVVLFSPRT